MTSNSCCSVARDLSRPPFPGIDCCLSAALTGTFASTTPSSSTRFDFLLRLLDKPVDIVIGQTGRDDARPRYATAGDIVTRSSGSRPRFASSAATFPTVVSITSLCEAMGLLLALNLGFLPLPVKFGPAKRAAAHPTP
jgi:hypothetical protein